MVKRIEFENSTGKPLQICIEPFAEYIDWEEGKILDIELKLNNSKYDDKLSIAFTPNIMVIYECRQYEMKIWINKELKYSTPTDRYL